VPDFDYDAKPKGALEVSRTERIAQIRSRKADERARAKVNADRRAGGGGGGGRPAPSRPGHAQAGSGGGGREGGAPRSRRRGGRGGVRARR
jgi:hypothetical protein